MTKRKSKKSAMHDPFAEREAQKYENPIPSREFILELLKSHKKPMIREELEAALALETEEQKEGLRRRLKAMCRDAQIVQTRSAYGLLEKMNLLRGYVIGHKEGYGFVSLEEGGDDMFLSPFEMRGVFDGDRVLVRLSGLDKRGRREAAVVEVLERAHQQMVGRYFFENGVGYLQPSNKRINQAILIPPTETNGAKHGQMVVVDIIIPPSSRTQAIGKIVEVLGDHLAPGMEIDVALRTHALPYEWPQDVLQEIQNISKTISSEEIADRVDLRDLPLVTIDGEDAKDFDDAVFAEKRKTGWRLIVAIADVSHYVKPKTALDKEAVNRGNSVYFPNQVIPMLPEVLSNEMCSLKPNVDRLCLACDMQLNKAGKVTKYEFYPAVMHSANRYTYNQVYAMIQEKKAPENIQHLYALYQALRKMREERGAIDFETTETQIIFGAGRKIEKIVPRQRNEAHRLIEECMLLANDCTARFLIKNKLPILFRVHLGPREEKLSDLRDFLSGMGLSLPGSSEPEPADYAALLSAIKGRPDEHLIQTVLLRSMSQAVYSPENQGHFGLAYEAYTHFTSPIRRYPDLLVHRAIKHLLNGGKAKNFIYDKAQMVSLGEHTSMTERRADDATRDAVNTLKCEFMLDRVGEEFDGIITAVTGFGLFVELKNIFVEGLVHVTALKNDYYQFDPAKRRLKGERTGMTYRLGDPIRVKVVRVSVDAHQIDFELAAQKNESVNKKNKSPEKTKSKPKSRAKKRR